MDPDVSCSDLGFTLTPVVIRLRSMHSEAGLVTADAQASMMAMQARASGQRAVPRAMVMLYCETLGAGNSLNRENNPAPKEWSHRVAEWVSAFE